MTLLFFFAKFTHSFMRKSNEIILHKGEIIMLIYLLVTLLIVYVMMDVIEMTDGTAH